MTSCLHICGCGTATSKPPRWAVPITSADTIRGCGDGSAPSPDVTGRHPGAAHVRLLCCGVPSLQQKPLRTAAALLLSSNNFFSFTFFK